MSLFCRILCLLLLEGAWINQTILQIKQASVSPNAKGIVFI